MSTRHIGGLWLLCDDLGDRVEDALQADSGCVPIFLPTTSLAARSSCLVLLSLSPETIDYMAVATAGRRGSFLERKVVCGPAVKLPVIVAVERLLARIPAKFRQHIAIPKHRVSGIPPATWDSLLDAVVQLSEIGSRDFDRLKRILDAKRTAEREAIGDIVNFERDATAVSLEAFRGSALRQRYLSSTPINNDAPFIKSLQQSGATVLEDRMIDHDLATFPGAQAMRRHIIGAVTIQSDTGAITIVNANRTGIEKTLGVDLVYYHHDYGAFTLVQYKRLTGEREPVYRPSGDSSYEKEVARMRNFSASLSRPNSWQLESYRLLINPFFFKFCAAQQDVHWSRMLPGMYLPLELLEAFVSSDEAIGPKGGIVIGYDNTNRRMNNSQFVQLIRGGWIGSSGLDSARINSIIEQELSSDKSIIAAIHRESSRDDDFLRDTRGRFAAEDDPEAI